MKTVLRTIAIAAAFIGLLPTTSFAQTQDNALYVYRNDGDFTAFLREDIDSITLSHYDADSVYQSECVTQVFHTPDSVYRIPIAAIDSVSLVQPETKYQDDVMLLEARHLPYIVEATDSTIAFLSSTPAELLPSVGTVLAAMVFDTPLEKGFAGRVERIENSSGNIVFVCSEVNIGDIYKRIVYTSKFQVYANEESESLAKKRKSGAVTRGSGSFDPVYLGAITAEAGPVSVSAEPTLSGFYTINHNENLKTHLALILNADIATEVSLSANIENPNSDPLIAWCPSDIKIPTNVAGLTGFIQGGAFFKVSASAEVSAKWPGHLHGKFGFTKDDDGVKRINSLKYTTGQSECSVNMSGEIDAGLCVRMGLAVIDEDLLSCHVTGYGGLYAKAEFSLTPEGLADGSLYSALKDSQLEVGYYFSGEPGYSILGEDKKFIVPGTKDTEFSIGLERRKELAKWYLLPEFTQPEYTRGAEETTAVLTTNPSRDLLMPVNLGIGVETEGGEAVDTKWSSVEYQNEEEWTLKGLSATFDGLSAGETYKAYPYVRILGKELRATPEKDFALDVTVNTLAATNVKAASATLNGSVAGIDFSATNNVTVGFLYGTNSNLQIGSSSFVSCAAGKDFSCTLSGLTAKTPYYYRACVVVNSTEYYGSVQSFTTKELEPTPGDAIDLGLSVKWASCNVGASSPEGYGGYYAWGETEEKSSYTYDTYAYYSDDAGWMNIGSDIAGTSYDVAHVKWGGSWHMPTVTQIEELVNSCTWTWTTYNGVNGQLVTGPNGNSIFLPAAGYRYGTSLHSAGGLGGYWSSSAGGATPTTPTAWASAVAATAGTTAAAVRRVLSPPCLRIKAIACLIYLINLIYSSVAIKRPRTPYPPQGGSKNFLRNGNIR